MTTLRMMALGSAVALATGCSGITERAAALCAAGGPPDPLCVATVAESMRADRRAALDDNDEQVMWLAVRAMHDRHAAAAPRVCSVVPYGTGATVSGSYAYCQ